MGNALADSVATYIWHDTNANKRSTRRGELRFERAGLRRGAWKSARRSRALAQPEREGADDRRVLAVVRAAADPNLALRATASTRANTTRIVSRTTTGPNDVYNIPITARDPGPDGRLGTPTIWDDGDYFEYPVAYQGARSRSDARHDKRSRQLPERRGCRHKRMSNHWMMMASYSATKLHVPFVSNTAGLTDFTEAAADRHPGDVRIRTPRSS